MSSSVKRASEERTGSKHPALSVQNVLVWSRNYMQKQNYTEQNAEAIYATKQAEMPHSETKGENLSHRKILLYHTF
jgi:hypothetical protein